MEKSNQVQQDSNLSIYERVRCVPNEAKKEIEAGRLKGKHDINSEDSLIRNPTAKTGHPNIFRYLENCFRRYAWTKACILSTPHLSEGTPWYQTRRSNPDRWGVRIEDELISEWFMPRV